MCLLLLSAKGLDRISEHAVMESEGRLAREEISPVEMVHRLVRIVCHVMGHFRILHNRAISAPPHLEFLLSCHLIVCNV